MFIKGGTPEMKKHMIHVLIGLFVFTSVAISLYSQEGRGSGRLIGEVVDNDKKPLEGVKISLEYINYNYRLNTVSDKNGVWGFMGLGMGQVKITAEKEGYTPSGIGISVSGASKNPKQLITMYKVGENPQGASAENQQADQQIDKMKSEFEKGSTLFKEGKFETALAVFQDLRAQKPELYKMGINIGCCLLELQRYDESLTEFQTVLDKLLAEPKDPAKNEPNLELAKVYASIGDVYMRQNKFKEAEEFFKKSMDISPTDHTLPYNVAEILFASGKTDEAIPYYQMAVKIKPDWAKAYMQLGYALLNKGDTKTAVESFKKFLELAPTSPDAEAVKEVIKSL